MRNDREDHFLTALEWRLEERRVKDRLTKNNMTRRIV